MLSNTHGYTGEVDNNSAGQAPVLNDDLAHVLVDAAAGSLSRGLAAVKVMNRIEGRAPLDQILAVVVGLLREQHAELDRLEPENDNLEEALERLQRDAGA